jgi:hypothetical protein
MIQLNEKSNSYVEVGDEGVNEDTTSKSGLGDVDQMYKAVSIPLTENVMGLNAIQMPLDLQFSLHNPMTSFLHYANKKSEGMLRKGKWTVIIFSRYSFAI